jgi:hypothetical protein
MRHVLKILGLVVIAGAASSALAGEKGHCADAARDKWLPETAIKGKLSALGYEIRKIEAENGCYEVKATDKNGAKVELYVHPVTGEVIKPSTETKEKSL